MSKQSSFKPDTVYLRQALQLSKPLILEILTQAQFEQSIKNIRAKHWDEKDENWGLVPITLRTHTDINKILPLLEKALNSGAYPLQISSSNPSHNELNLHFIGNKHLSRNQIQNAQLPLYINKLLAQLRKIQTRYNHELAALQNQSKTSDKASFITHIVELIQALNEKYEPQIKEIQSKIRITQEKQEQVS